MSTVLETTATAEDAYHLTLHEPLKTVPSGPVHISVMLTAAEEDRPQIVYPKDWIQKTPEERAENFRKWVASHADGVGLSDWAVSRDSIYD